MRAVNARRIADSLDPRRECGCIPAGRRYVWSCRNGGPEQFKEAAPCSPSDAQDREGRLS